MLRIFRLDPKFELDPCPINAMYIDIESEDEIKEKYIKKKDTEREFYRSPQWEEGDAYMGNYLVLKEKSTDCEPTISDIDVMKKVPALSLPPTYAIGIEDLMRDLRERDVTCITEPFIATKPSEFIISIRSVYSDSEKLTVDQNEALMCGFAYCYPDPPPRIMFFGQSAGIEPDGYVRKGPGEKRLRTINYKGHDIVPGSVIDSEMENPGFLVYQAQLLSSISHLYFVRLSDEDIRCRTLFDGPGKRKVSLGINELPPPLHSDYLIHNMVNQDNGVLKISKGTRFGIAYALEHPKSFLRGPYKNAIVPCLEQFKLLTE